MTDIDKLRALLIKARHADNRYDVLKAAATMREHVDEAIVLLDAEPAPAEPDVEALLTEWCHQHGAALVPGPGDTDSYGDGMRAAKRQVLAILDAQGQAAPLTGPERPAPTDAERKAREALAGHDAECGSFGCRRLRGHPNECQPQDGDERGWQALRALLSERRGEEDSR